MTAVTKRLELEKDLGERGKRHGRGAKGAAETEGVAAWTGQRTRPHTSIAPHVIVPKPAR